jgi:glycosyltransferase involved in cell wall biosynthesis
MKTSIVIPVYNEAERLADCLRAIARQAVRPYEVIVVDNNSTDDTAKIAAGFDFVRLLKEPRQGVVHARNRGFNAARGDIIGRIDADTILPAGWTAKVQSIFNDKNVSAVSGAPEFYDFAWDVIAEAIDWGMRGWLTRKLANQNFLWGANMAVRRSAWHKIRAELCEQRRMHEDFDLGIHLQAHGMAVKYDPDLLAGVSIRRIDSGFASYVRYSLVSPRTYARHGLTSRRHMYPVLLICWLCYLPGRFIYRAYDPLTKEFSLGQLLAAPDTRIDPTSNVV